MVDQTNLTDLMGMYLNECALRKLAPRTIEGYRKMLRPMLLWLGDNEQIETVGDLVPQHYKMYLLYKEKNGASPQYINDILRVMRTFSRYLYRLCPPVWYSRGRILEQKPYQSAHDARQLKII